jgi:uncharacterized protein (DUF58 family)
LSPRPAGLHAARPDTAQPDTPGLGSRGRLRPINAVGPIAGSIFTLLAWAAIAHNSGSGWVQALGAVLGAVLLVGIFGPGRAVARTKVDVVNTPVDAVAGDPFEIELTATSRVRIRPVFPGGAPAFVGPAEAGPTRLEIVQQRRGILVGISVDVASAAPFGILWWSRRTTLVLPAEVNVAPKPTTSIKIPPEIDDWNGESPGRRSAMIGETRGIRNYEHGDPKRLVNWRASAHTGHLMVRELEAPSSDPVIVRLELPADPQAADELAGRALATILKIIDNSRQVMLATREVSGERVAQVTGPTDAGRRLARAIGRGSGAGSLSVEDPQQHELLR